MAVVGVAEEAEITEVLALLIEAAELVGMSDILISFIAALTSLVCAIINLK